MANLENFLTELGTGLSEQADQLDATGDSGGVSSTLRDYASQLWAVADETDDHERVDWSKLEDRVGIDLEPATD